MKGAWLVPTAVLVGACGADLLTFEPADAGSSSVAEGGGDAGTDAASERPGCAVDTDCLLSSLHCDTSTPSGQCVACLRNDQCFEPGYRTCDYDLKQCVQCLVDSDCSGGRCELTTHRCIPLCPDGGACPSGLQCERGECIECNDITLFCSGYRTPQLCNPNLGRCVQCIDDADCGGTHPTCDRTEGRCVECLTSSSCPPWEVCDPEIHGCVDLATATFAYDGGSAGAPRDAGLVLEVDARP